MITLTLFSCTIKRHRAAGVDRNVIVQLCIRSFVSNDAPIFRAIDQLTHAQEKEIKHCLKIWIAVLAHNRNRRLASETVRKQALKAQCINGENAHWEFKNILQAFKIDFIGGQTAKPSIFRSAFTNRSGVARQRIRVLAINDSSASWHIDSTFRFSTY